MKKILLLILITSSPLISAKEYSFHTQSYTLLDNEQTIHAAYQNIREGAKTGQWKYTGELPSMTDNGASLLQINQKIIGQVKLERTDLIQGLTVYFNRFIEGLKIQPDNQNHRFEDYLQQEIKSPVFKEQDENLTCEDIALKTIKNHQVASGSTLIEKEVYKKKVQSLLANGYPCKYEDRIIHLPSFVTEHNKLSLINSLLKIAKEFGYKNNLIFEILDLKTENSRQIKIKNYLALRALLLTQLGKINPSQIDRDAFLMQVPTLVIREPSEDTSSYLSKDLISHKEMAEVLGE